jgi:hypothetical protein
MLVYHHEKMAVASQMTASQTQSRTKHCDGLLDSWSP